jgi:two-component system response regulator NreC
MIIQEERIGDSVCIVRDGDEVLRIAIEEKPVCIVLCMFLPTLGGVGILRNLKAMDVSIPTLCFCDTMKTRNGVIAIKEGARGVIDLSRGRTEFGKAMRTVREGRRYIPEDVRQMLDDREFEYHPEKFRDMSLRENEVLQMVARGHSNKEVACRLMISEKPWRSIRRISGDKLGLTSSTEICFFAIQEGLVDVKEDIRCLYSAKERNFGGSMEPARPEEVPG